MSENTARLQGMKNTKLEIKLIKRGRKPGTTYCLEWKDYTNNSKPQQIKMINKVLREKSDCVVCRSSQSRFLKQKRNSEK